MNGRIRIVFVAAVGFELSLALLALFLGAVSGFAPFATLNADAYTTALGVAACVPMLAAFALLRNVQWEPLREVQIEVERAVATLFPEPSSIGFAAVSLAAGIGEEALFRGLAQGALQHWLGVGAGLAAASILFGLAHSITRAYVVIAALIGAYLGWIWNVTGSLWVPIVAHATYDFVVLCLIANRATSETVSTT